MRRVVASREWMDAVEEGVEIPLDEETGRHVRAVLRLTKGQWLELLDGTGRRTRARLVRTTPRATVVIPGPVEACTEGESGLQLELAVAQPKGDRWDWLVQKCTELGATSLRPISTARSQRTVPADKVKGRLDRWTRIASDAARQCKRARAPEISAPASLQHYLASLGPAPTDTELRIVAAAGERGEYRLGDLLRPARDRGTVSSVRLLVGPEGGFEASEVAAATAADFEAVTLGDRILRVETAAVALTTICQYELGDLG